MNIVEYGAPGIFTQAGSILAMPATGSGLTSIMAVAEQVQPVPFCWTTTSDRTRLVLDPDGFSGLAYTDAAAVAASSILVGFFFGRIRLIRFAPAEWAAAANQTFSPPPGGMSPADLTAQFRTAGNFPFGTVPQTSVGI